MALDIKISSQKFSVAQYGIISITLAFATASYVFSSVIGLSLFGLVQLLDVGAEQSIPTYVSVMNLFFGSVLVYVIYLYERSISDPGARNWLILCLLFLYLSVDEACRIHERFAGLHDILVDKQLMSPILETHQWLPFGVLFLIVCSIILVPLFKQLPRDTLRRFLLAGFIFVSGAVGFEYLGAVMLETGFVESRSEPAYLARRLFEEGLEMYGVVVFNCAVYTEIQRRDISVLLRASGL